VEGWRCILLEMSLPLGGGIDREGASPWLPSVLSHARKLPKHHQAAVSLASKILCLCFGPPSRIRSFALVSTVTRRLRHWKSFPRDLNGLALPRW
jgi:hypothetical protein